MREFTSLKTEKIPDGFTSEMFGGEPMVELSEKEGHITLNYTFPGFYKSLRQHKMGDSTVDFSSLKIKSTGFWSQSGKPLLPSFGRYLNIPKDCDFSYIVKKGNATEIKNIVVTPSQAMVTDEDKKHPFEYDMETYSKDELMPSSLVEVTGPFNIEDYSALLVHVRPMQYNPAKKLLVCYSNISLTFNLIPRNTDSNRITFINDAGTDKQAFGNLFLNPKKNIEDRVNVNTDAVGPVAPLLKGPQLLVIYHNTFKKAAEKYCLWKNRKGISTEMVVIDQIGNTPGQIKTYIRNKRNGLSRLRYVMLLGDFDHIVPETIQGGTFGSNITDYYYATENDPATPNSFVFPWLSVGRIPVRNTNDANKVVEKIIEYEKNPPADTHYYKRIVVAAFFQEDNAPGTPGYGTDDRAYLKTMEEIRNFLVSIGFEVERIYVSNNPAPKFYIDGTPIPADVQAAFMKENTASDRLIKATNEGQLIIGHRDHGSESGWAHPPFTLNHLDRIATATPSIFFSINCLTGLFDEINENFAEKLIRITGAAPSLVAATRVSHTWLNNDLIRALFDAMFGGMLPTFPGTTTSYPVKNCRLGDMLNYAKTYLPLTSSGSAADIKDHTEIYHVIGDPCIEVWKAAPTAMRLNASILWNRILDIRLSSCPVDSVITIWDDEKLLKTLTPTSTHIRIPLTGLVSIPQITAGTPVLYVCFSAPGYHYTEKKVVKASIAELQEITA